MGPYAGERKGVAPSGRSDLGASIAGTIGASWVVGLGRARVSFPFFSLSFFICNIG